MKSYNRKFLERQDSGRRPESALVVNDWL